MRRFANLYIVLYLFDAGLSLLDELLKYFADPVALLTLSRSVVAYVVLTLSLVLYLCLGIDRRLPKRVLLPLTLYVFWSALALWPLSGLVARESLGVLVSFGQVFVAGVALITLRSLGGRSLLTWDQFLLPLFSWRNTLVFTALNLLLLPLLSLYALLALTGIYLDQSSAGFMRLSPVGIYMAERSYHRGPQRVHLAAMVHVGREDYYAEMTEALATAGTVILAEGVTDEDGLLQSRFDYGNLAGLVGLTSQEQMQLDGNLVDLVDIDAEERDVDKPDIVRADVDIRSFTPETIEFLNMLGATLLSDKPLAQGIAEYNRWAQQHVSPQWLPALLEDLLEKRNAVLIETLRQSLKQYDTVIIPWGALHMPGIEAAVLEQGFVADGRRERLSLDFRTIPYGRLWQKWQEGVQKVEAAQGGVGPASLEQ